MEGSLSKWTNVVNGWQYRWFVLDDNAGLLSYYTSKEKMMRGARRGCVRLRGAIIGIDDEDDSTFTITTSSYKDDSKTFHFQTCNSEERERWIQALEDTILRHSHTRWDPKRSPPKRDFDRKVAEADVYLQLLIDQMKSLDKKQEESSIGCHKYSNVLIQANTMLNSIKHTIVQLQIAKNTAIPVNGTYTGTNSISPSSMSVTLMSVEEAESNIPPDVEIGCEPRISMLHDRNLPVPQFSYSSSDEDENYYDAADEIPTSSANNERIRNYNIEDGNNKPFPPPIRNDGSLDYDALYEEESDSEMNGIEENHGSVITHLLSQVKIGMDLTKVALPTFILERRSLLEMYADYFAHPDEFVSIADKPTPRERMIQVVRWYLCSFHAGRKSGVAKKPYNPVLGEIFRCYWNMNNWGDLKFIAEQVSHHPPVSAFYAEHPHKKICFNAHVWTKSKFLGLSVGVHNIGKGVVSLLEQDEEYILTFPNGYGRSILTVPWIELGGDVSIQCPQTGYQASIEFLTKPFYGGKRNKITCQINQPGDKKPFLCINGEWSGAMEAKWADGRIENFADVKELRIHKKIVKPICEQEDCESRKVWKDVTVGLRINDMDKASKAKCFIEQKQRDEAKRRKDNNVSWKTRYFQETKDSGWIYVDCLKN